jgi:outer membrane protein OmpA-like peptidoglycan-associated protein
MRAASASLRLISALAAVLALTACAPVTRVVLLPQPNHDSVVEVAPRARVSAGQPTAMQDGVPAAAPGARVASLTKPYQTAVVGASNQVSVEQWSAARVQSRYGGLLAAQPPVERNYLLYFEFNDTQLTSESAAQLDSVIEQAMARRGNEIVVTGHTDSVGTAQANDELSLERAQVIRQAIIARGFDPARIYAAGRGSRNPLVSSGDQAAQQKNRRVEITVR